MYLSKSLKSWRVYNPDRFEQVFDTPETSEKLFTDDISMFRPQKMFIFSVSKIFTNNFTHCNLY